MEFFLNDPNVERLPPERTRLLDLRAEPDADGKRLRVTLELTPFQQRPYIELAVSDAGGQEIASASIVEPAGWKLEVTLHLRFDGPAAGSCQLLAVLSYPELNEVDRRSLTFTISPSPADS